MMINRWMEWGTHFSDKPIFHPFFWRLLILTQTQSHGRRARMQPYFVCSRMCLDIHVQTNPVFPTESIFYLWITRYLLASQLSSLQLITPIVGGSSGLKQQFYHSKPANEPYKAPDWVHGVSHCEACKFENHSLHPRNHSRYHIIS